MRETHKKGQPNVDIRAGTAYELPVEDASVDAVICAQAFHWFANAEALKEFARVLKPGGSLGLIWNFYDQSLWPKYQAMIFVPNDNYAANSRMNHGVTKMAFLSIGIWNGLKPLIPTLQASIMNCR
jgi:ubiquinone/menaquinone biosynthesis C-methylase UbiE